MNPRPESVKVPQTIHTVRDDVPRTNPRPRTVYDPWVRRALIVYAQSTR